MFINKLSSIFDFQDLEMWSWNDSMHQWYGPVGAIYGAGAHIPPEHDHSFEYGFCFDFLDNEMVALSCPKKSINVKINKCCPLGQIMNDNGDCIQEKETAFYTILVDGHLRDASKLMDKQDIAYTNDSQEVKQFLKFIIEVSKNHF